MKRYLRGLCNAVAVLSLLLFAATLFLWPWSHLHDTWLEHMALYSRDQSVQQLRMRSFGVRRGYFVFELYSVPPRLAKYRTPVDFAWVISDNLLQKGQRFGPPFRLGQIRSSGGSGDTREYLGFIVSSCDNISPDTDDGQPLHTIATVVGIPFWFLCPLFGLAPAAQLSAIRRRRIARTRARNSLCSACGYDLRASPERCPECGTAAPLPSPGTPGEG